MATTLIAVALSTESMSSLDDRVRAGALPNATRGCDKDKYIGAVPQARIAHDSEGVTYTPMQVDPLKAPPTTILVFRQGKLQGAGVRGRHT